MNKIALSTFSIGAYKPGPKFKVWVWYLINSYIFESRIPWPYRIKILLLRSFGAKVGNGLVIKPRVKIKYPWRLIIGNHCWLGEGVWIDNLDTVEIGSDVCVSQGAMLLTGNHDYTLSDFPYKLGKIKLEDGVWIGAKSVVCPGVVCKENSILTVNSVATKHLDEMKIYTGNPAIFIRNRIIK